jgi:Tol biopolymer transport system component
MAKIIPVLLLILLMFSGCGTPNGTDDDYTPPIDENAGIYVMDANGTNLTKLTSDADDYIYPAWSPDGTRIAFTSFFRDYDWEIYIMNADGTNQTRLTHYSSDPDPYSFVEDLAWSPDGTRIAFVYSSDIYVMNADGSNQTNLTNNSLFDFNPAWSPDGTRIVFVSCGPSTEL